MKPWRIIAFGLLGFVLPSLIAWEEYGWAGLIGTYCVIGVLALIGFIESNHEKKTGKPAAHKRNSSGDSYIDAGGGDFGGGD